MKGIARFGLPAAAALLLVGLGACAMDRQAEAGDGMSFFVTSVGSGRGADLGGLEGADRHCQKLAQAAGAGGRTWRAYLSTQSMGGTPAVNARDRIGQGPWQNAKATVIARNVNDLHGANNITKETALTENGDVGSQPDGTAFAVAEDRTCGNWTKSGADGAAMVGHNDRRGLNEDPPAKSWNSSHLIRGGCSQEALKGTGGAGLLYCFAAY